MASDDDTNGIVATADDADAACQDCKWETDGDGQSVMDQAHEHADKTGHTVDVSGTVYATVTP